MLCLIAGYQSLTAVNVQYSHLNIDLLDGALKLCKFSAALSILQLLARIGSQPTNQSCRIVLLGRSSKSHCYNSQFSYS